MRDGTLVGRGARERDAGHAHTKKTFASVLLPRPAGAGDQRSYSQFETPIGKKICRSSHRAGKEGHARPGKTSNGGHAPGTLLRESVCSRPPDALTPPPPLRPPLPLSTQPSTSPGACPPSPAKPPGSPSQPPSATRSSSSGVAACRTACTRSRPVSGKMDGWRGDGRGRVVLTSPLTPSLPFTPLQASACPTRRRTRTRPARSSRR